jgi:hypothetical protein
MGAYLDGWWYLRDTNMGGPPILTENYGPPG